MGRSRNSIDSIHPSPRVSPTTQYNALGSDGQERDGGKLVAAHSDLPDKHVTADTIEDAFASFILHCNPAVPPETDTAALREAFRMPPKSGGKTFSSFRLFQLICELDKKTLKTWAELALKLGVEPPDTEKGQSSQKIQQYAVRLKRWMHSMHVDAFFDYLLGNPHSYWTDIPNESTPICTGGRDGVAAEDDMALRALLPHIRPKRGRRKPEDDDLNKEPSQRPRLQSPTTGYNFGCARPDGRDLWSAHPDGCNLFFPDNGRLDAAPVWQRADAANQVSLAAHPHSAITPSTRVGFWENDSRSTGTSSKSRSIGKRYGAKVVSSAWRSGSGSGKTRGRPPINRAAAATFIEGPFSAFPTTETSLSAKPGLSRYNEAVFSSAFTGDDGSQFPTPFSSATCDARVCSTASTPALPLSTITTENVIKSSGLPDSLPPSRPPQRTAKISRLSLQVPERPPGSVRLATPPPMVLIDGRESSGQTHSTNTNVENTCSMASPNVLAPCEPIGSPAPACAPETLCEPPDFRPYSGPTNEIHNGHVFIYALSNSQASNSEASEDPRTSLLKLENPNEYTNMVALNSNLFAAILGGEWYNNKGQQVAAGSIEEVTGIIQSVIDTLVKKAHTSEAFLVNLAVLLGTRLLQGDRPVRITRIFEGNDYTEYTCNWQLKFGVVQGTFEIKQTVPHKVWKKIVESPKSKSLDSSSSEWAKKYEDLLGVVQDREREMERLREKLTEILSDTAGRKIVRPG